MKSMQSDVSDILNDFLLYDLNRIGINTSSFKLVLRPYSKTCYGKYRPWCKEVVVYLYKDSKQEELYPYQKLLETTIHEVVHHMQHSNPDFVRSRGIMHDTEFYRLYNSFVQKYNKMKGTIHLEFSKKNGRYRN